MTIDQLKERIKKFRALSRSSNPHEAALAKQHLEAAEKQLAARTSGGGLLQDLKAFADIIEDKDGSGAAAAEEKSWGDIWGDLADAFKGPSHVTKEKK